jgi:hypothetical protein
LVVGFKVKSGMLAGARGRFGKFLFLLGLSDVGEVLWKRLGGMRGMAAGAGGGIGEDVPQERGRGGAAGRHQEVRSQSRQDSAEAGGAR